MVGYLRFSFKLRPNKHEKFEGSKEEEKEGLQLIRAGLHKTKKSDTGKEEFIPPLLRLYKILALS